MRDVDKAAPLPPGLAAVDRPAGAADALLPALAAGPALGDDAAVVAGAHAAGVGLADAGDHEQRRRVHQHELEHRVVGRHLHPQKPPEDLGVLARLPARRHRRQRVRRQPEVGRRQLEVPDLDRPRGRGRGTVRVSPPALPGNQHPAQRGTGARDLVELLAAADDERPPGSSAGACRRGDAQGLGEDGAEVVAGDAQQAGLDGGVDRVAERAQQVEDGAPAELAPHLRDVPHARVEDGREQEGVVGARVHGGERGGAHARQLRRARAHRQQQVRRPGLRRRRAVPVLGDQE